MFARTVEASFHRGDAGFENFGDLRMAAALLDEGQQGPVLRTELGEGMPQRIQLLRIDGAGRLGDVLMFLAERQKDAPQFLPAQLIDAGVAREPEQDSNCSGACSRSSARIILMKTCCAKSSTVSLRPFMA